MSSESAPRRSATCRAPASSTSPPRRRSAASRAGDPDWCNLGQGQPETGDAARRAAARARACRSRVGRSGVRAGRRPVGAARGDRRPLQPPLPPRHAVAVLAPRTSRLRRRPRGAHARRRERSATSTSATSCPTTRRTRSCSTSSGRSRAIPILLERRARLRVLRRRSAPRDPRAAASRRCSLSNPCNPTGKLVGGDELAALGRRSRASSTAR